jgi:hypothetical protein
MAEQDASVARIAVDGLGLNSTSHHEGSMMSSYEHVLFRAAVLAWVALGASLPAAVRAEEICGPVFFPPDSVEEICVESFLCPSRVGPEAELCAEVCSTARFPPEGCEEPLDPQEVCGPGAVLSGDICIPCGRDQEVVENQCVDLQPPPGADPVRCGPDEMQVEDRCEACEFFQRLVAGVCTDPRGTERRIQGEIEEILVPADPRVVPVNTSGIPGNRPINVDVPTNVLLVRVTNLGPLGAGVTVSAEFNSGTSQDRGGIIAPGFPQEFRFDGFFGSFPIRSKVSVSTVGDNLLQVEFFGRTQRRIDP